jgi:hypothetical protein
MFPNGFGTPHTIRVEAQLPVVTENLIRYDISRSRHVVLASCTTGTNFTLTPSPISWTTVISQLDRQPHGWHEDVITMQMNRIQAARR